MENNKSRFLGGVSSVGASTLGVSFLITTW